jgi:hypothetical protein
LDVGGGANCGPGEETEDDERNTGGGSEKALSG